MSSFNRFYFLIIVAGLLYANVAFAQPCVNGLSDGYPCDKIALTSKVNLADLGGTAGNDIWGYRSPVGREYALMGMREGVAFVNVTVPDSPVVIGMLPSHTGGASSWRDIREKNGYAYIGADRVNDHGIQIFDLSLLDAAVDDPMSVFPITFNETSQVDFGVNGWSHNLVTNFNPASNFLYAVGQRAYCSGGVTVFDLTDPEMPTQEQCYEADLYSHDMICINYRGPDVEHIGQEICIGFNEDIYSIIDMTNKENIIGLSAETYPGEGYTHQGWVSDDHKYLMLDDELDERDSLHNVRTYFFDISDLDNPVPMAGNFYEHNITSIDHNMFVKGPYLYQANYEAGLRILDIGDLDNGISTITEAGYFDILPVRDTKSFNGAWGVFPYLPSGNILVSGLKDLNGSSDQTGGLFVLTPDLPHHYLTTDIATEIQTVCAGTPVNFTFNKNDLYGFTGTVDYAVENLDPSLTSALTDDANSVTVAITNTDSLKNNSYFTLKSTPVNGTSASKISGAIIVTPIPVAAPLLTPVDNSQTNDETPSFIWTPAPDTESYDIEIATDAGITNIIQSSNGLTTNEYNATPLADKTEYFWRVTSFNSCGQTASTIRSFIVDSGVVPVELVSFDGYHRNKTNHLHWKTAAEINNAGFEIQRKQADRDRTYKKVGWSDAKSATGATYEFEDERIAAGALYYYRLKQIDLDGNFEYSPLISISVPGKHPGLIIYPNPVANLLSLDLFLPDLQDAENVQFSIISLTGQEIQRWNFNPEMPLSTQHISVENLSPGVYIGMVTQGTVRLPIRFVKL